MGSADVQGRTSAQNNASWGLAGREIAFTSLEPGQHVVRNNGKGTDCWFASIGAGSTVTFDHRTGDACRAGGVLAFGGSVLGDKLDVEGNGGPGILARDDAKLVTPIRLVNNQGSGLQTQAGTFHLLASDSEPLQAIGNIGHGLLVSGTLTVDAPLEVQDNAGWGLIGCNVYLKPDYTHVISGNGSGPDCWTAVIQGEDNYLPTLTKQACPRGGGVLAHGGSVTGGNVSIVGNNGAGVLARGGVDIDASRGIFRVQDNMGYGIQAETGDVKIRGTYGVDLSANQGAGVRAANRLEVRGSLLAHFNAGYGLEGDSVVIGNAPGSSSTQAHRIRENGGFAGQNTCLLAQLVAAHFDQPEYVLQTCGDAGIKANTLEGSSLEISENHGNGIEANQVNMNLSELISNYATVGADGNGVAFVPRPGQQGAQASALAVTSHISNSVIADNEGDGIRFTTDDELIVQQTNLLANGGFGINNLSSPTTTLDARYNWWGDASGPGPVGPGSGDEVSAGVNYDPWLGDPIGMTASALEDPITAQRGQTVTGTVHIQNWRAPTDTVQVEFSDERSWLIEPTVVTVTLSTEEMGADVSVRINVPSDTSYTSDRVVALVTSLSGPDSVSTSFLVRLPSIYYFPILLKQSPFP